jgi:aspartate/methionine/tyrosine aminotransferase
MRSSHRAASFTESVIREMTRVARQHGAINLAQGFPDWPMPEPMKEAACAAIRGDVNQYAITWGNPALRLAIAEKYRRMYNMEVDPERDITVTCGATEAMAAAFLALLNPGDEVIIPEPFYENYGPDGILAGAEPVFVPLESPNWTLDSDRIRRAITPRTRALVLNSPHNPTGRVFTREEIGGVAALCVEHNITVLTDDPYEYITYAGHHHPIATWPGMRDHTVTISSLSKTFSCTGWRIGYTIAPAEATAAIRKVHDFLTIGAPAPLQAAAAVGYAFDAEYFNHLSRDYRARRDLLAVALADAGFKFTMPEGAYYFFADFSELSEQPDTEFALWLAREVGIATVPGSSFYHEREMGRRYTRFAFCKKMETLEAAIERLAKLRALV